MVLGSLMTGCWWSKKDPIPEPVIEEPEVEVVEPEPEIDPEVEFEEAVKEIPIEEVETFVEVVDEGDADEMLVPATPQEIEAREDEATKASRVKVKRMASASYRDEMGANEVGLDYRDFSEETFKELYGIRPIMVYVTDPSCVECAAWDEELRNNADKLILVNALVLKANFNEVPDFRKDYKVEAPGQAVFLSPMGEAMGTMSNPEVDSLIKFFGKFKR